MSIRKYKNSNDEQLMQLICNGDANAFNALYSRYKDQLFYYFFRMLGGSKETANDFLQDLFLKLIEKADTYNPQYCFSTWLYSIAHNMCKNEYRRKEIRNIISYEENPDRFSIPFDKQEEAQLLINKLFSELDNLGEEHRSIFILRYRKGFSLKEICSITTLPEGTVKSRLFYARQKLSSLMHKHKAHLLNE